MINSEGKVQFGLRPEDVQLNPGGDATASGDVFVVEDLGNERLITLDLGGQFVVAVAPRGDVAKAAAVAFGPGFLVVAGFEGTTDSETTWIRRIGP